MFDKYGDAGEELDSLLGKITALVSQFLVEHDKRDPVLLRAIGANVLSTVSDVIEERVYRLAIPRRRADRGLERKREDLDNEQEEDDD